MKQSISLVLSLACCLVGSLLEFSPAIAQVTTDGTTNTTVNADGNNFTIQQGDRAGSNLFHSFRDFSVPNGGSAFFDNADVIKNIFSRVTGGNISNIDGLLRANDANLFLINPAGIIFGAGARLDLGGGSFYGSSADSILFEDGEFSATDLDNPPLLTINAPIGLNFRDNPADITVRGNGNGARLEDSEVIDTQEALRLGSDATIGIVGGNLFFEDATMKTAGGRIEIGSVAGGEVDLVEVANGYSFDYSGVETFKDISLSGRSVIDASGLGGGDIQVAGRNISITGVSGFISHTLGSNPGGDINILATESLEISGIENELDFFSAIANRIFPNGTADAGDINIETGSLRLGDRAFIGTFVSGQGDAGNITINASDSISLESQGNGSLIAASNLTNTEVGNAGNIEITTPSLTLSNGASLNSNSSAGEAGNVTINATDDVSFNNASVINVSGSPGGSINITAKNLSLISDSRFFAGISSDSGIASIQSGDIVINLTEDLILDGLDGESITIIGNSNFGTGNAGNIEISARNITFNNGGAISSFNSGEGNIGNITLTATGDISFDGIKDSGRSGISNFVSEEATGNVGEINITAQNLTLTNGAFVQSLIGGTANSGDINLNIADNLRVDGSGNSVSSNGSQSVLASNISSSIGPGGIGEAGNINLNTQNLSLSRNGFIDTDVVNGRGNAGNINITADLITIGQQGTANVSPSEISSEAISGILENPLLEANGGNITINTGSLFISDGGGIEVDAFFSIGSSGDITISATDTVSVDGTGIFINPETLNEVEVRSDISASISPGSLGNGGSIEINAANFSLTNNAILNSSSSGQGNAGNITVEVRDNFTASNSLITSNIGTPQGDEAVGQVGNINIKAREVIFSDTAQIQAGLFSGAIGDPGTISITATESISFTGERTGIFSNNDPDSIGKASDTQLSAPTISLSNDAVITASNNGQGGGGNIILNANNLNLNSSSIFANTVSNEGGIINFNLADNLTLRNDSTISAQAFEDANGGNITIDTDFIVAFPNQNNDIIASADRGNGGNINITAESLFGIEERPLDDLTNDINASSQFGLDGSISIFTPDVNAIQVDSELPKNPIESEQTVAQACQIDRLTGKKSGLTVKGKGGIPPLPTEPFDSDAIIVNGQLTNLDPQVQSLDIKPIKTSQGDIYPARGIIKTEDGQVILTAYPTDSLTQRTPNGSANCGRL